MHIYQLLSQLSLEFSNETLEETINFIRQELIHPIRDGELDGLTVHMLLNDQEEPFFEALAAEFVADLITRPLSYFSLWEPLLAYLDRDSIHLFYGAAVRQAGATEAYTCCMGFWELENDRPAEAIAHFFNTTNELRHYGIAMAYQVLGSFENALCQYTDFLDIVIDPAYRGEEASMGEWHFHKETAYCYAQLGNTELACIEYAVTLGLFDIYKVHCLSIGRVGKKAGLIHSILVPALQAFEKENNHDLTKETIDYALDYFPADAYYKAVKQRLEASTAPQHAGSHLLTQVFQPSAHPCLQHPHPAPSVVKGMEQYIVDRIKAKGKVFDKQLSIYEDNECHGRQLYVPDAGCFIDLLLVDKRTATAYAVILTNGETATAKLHQLEHCCEALSLEMIREMKGILCVYGDDVIESISMEALDHIEVVKMSLSFNQLPCKQ
jgi:hypothetical protein